ncbi:hypothetical protein WDU94_000312 [Cyamophila willieti]
MSTLKSSMFTGVRISFPIPMLSIRTTSCRRMFKNDILTLMYHSVPDLATALVSYSTNE